MARIKWTRSQTAICLAIICVAICLILPCILQNVEVTPSLNSASSNMKQIVLALQNYHDIFGRLPPPSFTDQAGKPLYSWRVGLLPFIEHDVLYRQFKLDEPWDSPHNKPLLEHMPKTYSCWSSEGNFLPGMTPYQVFVGRNTAFEPGQGAGLSWSAFAKDRTDVLLVVAASEAVPWTKPADILYNPDEPLPAFVHYTKPTLHFLHCTFRYKPGFLAGFANGDVRFVFDETDEKTIRDYILRAGK
jgi:hypothetical protein